MEGRDFGYTAPPPQQKSPGLFIFLGCCVIAIGIFAAGNSVANRIPHSLHGNFHGNFSAGMTGFAEPGEFMGVWEAARFIGLHDAEHVNILVRDGELAGTYTVFQVEERHWRSGDVFWDTQTGLSIQQVHPPAVRVDAWGGVSEVAVPTLMEYDIVLVDMYIFSRERLTEWMMTRIDTGS